MKLLLFALALAIPAAAQQTTIGAAVYCPGCSHLNDATSGGKFSPHSSNNTYVVTISSTGTPDQFTWQKNGGAPSSPVSITGIPQTLTDGVTVTFGATTGHFGGDYWTISSTASGSLALQSVAQIGEGALPGRDAQEKSREVLSAADFGFSPFATDAANATALKNCVTQGIRKSGRCELPAGVYPMKDVTINLDDFGNIYHVGITGAGSAASNGGISFASATLIECTQTHGATGSATTGCISFISTRFNIPTYHFADFTMFGADFAGSTTTSANAIYIKGAASGTVYSERVQAYYFRGLGTAGLNITNPEGNHIVDFNGGSNDSCIILSTVNATTLDNPICNSSVHDQIYVENTQGIYINGGTVQNGSRNGIHMRGVNVAKIDGTHFELNNNMCSISTTGVQGPWYADTTYALNDLVYRGQTQAPILTTKGALSSYTYQTGFGWYKSLIASNLGNDPLTTPADWTAVNPLCHNATAADAVSTPVGYGAVILEAGTSSCDIWGLHCGYTGSNLNIFVDIEHTVLNTPGDQIYVFSNGSGGNLFPRFGPGYTGGAISPQIELDQNTGFPDDMGGVQFVTEGKPAVFGNLTLRASPGASGNNNIMALSDSTGQIFSLINHFQTSTTAMRDLYVGSFDGGATLLLPFGIDYGLDCVALGMPFCSTTYSADVGSKGTNSPLYAVGGTTVINASRQGTFASGTTIGGVAPLTTLPGGSISCASGHQITAVALSSGGTLTATCN